MIQPGEEWGEACDGAPDVEVEGTDRELADAVARHPGALIRFVPAGTSDVARAVGLHHEVEPRGWAVPMDALQLDDDRVAVNMLVLGTPPRRITWRTRAFPIEGEAEPALAVVVATGQFRYGLDVVPRGHPGDGWAELQTYRVPRRERAQQRKRLKTGSHVPHPKITQRRIRTIALTCPKPVPFEIDGVAAAPLRSVNVRVIPNAYRLLL